MDRNSVIGIILIGVIVFGFTFYQSKQAEKQYKYQSYLDSVERAEALEAYRLDSIARAEAIAAGDTVLLEEPVRASIYKDSLLEASHNAASEEVTLSNSKVEVVLTTKGAQPYSVKVKDYYNYDSTDLYVVRPGKSQLGFIVYAGENINTKDFVFDVTEVSDTCVVMRLPFAGGGYIEQKYVLAEDSYMVKDYLSFVGMDSVIPRNVSMFDMDWGAEIPRMEKGYKNEKQYSKLDYYFTGDKKPEEIGRGRDAQKRIDSKVKWVAFQQQFFSAILTGGKEFASADFGIKFAGEDDPERNLMTCTAQMRCEFTHGKDICMPFSFYFGPNHFQTLKQYDLKYEKIIPLGGSLVGWISRFVIIPCFNFLSRFIKSYGIIILIMTLLLKIVISPLTIKSYKSSAMMNVLKPEMDKINAKYPKQEDAMKKQQATMDLYKKAGVSPMGGCLPMLFQFPVLWAMFRFFPASIELRQQGFLWAEDLSAYDSILDFGFRVPLYGDHMSLFALLMAVTMFFYSKMTSQQMSDDPSMAGMKFMSVWMMPVMMLFICNNLSSGLSYYYLLSNLITIAQTWIIKKFFIDEKKIMARIAASSSKPVQKSKWQLRLEEAQKMQQQQARAQQKRR